MRHVATVAIIVCARLLGLNTSKYILNRYEELGLWSLSVPADVEALDVLVD